MRKEIITEPVGQRLQHSRDGLLNMEKNIIIARSIAVF